MDQTNAVLTMYQAMAVQNMIPKAGKTEGKTTDQFQKLLDRQAQSAPRDDAPQETPKAEAAPEQKQEAPVESEDPLERVKKLAEQGYAIFQPTVEMVAADGQVYQPGEYVVAWKGTTVEFVPTVNLDEGQMEVLDQLVSGANFGQAGELPVSVPISQPERVVDAAPEQVQRPEEEQAPVQSLDTQEAAAVEEAPDRPVRQTAAEQVRPQREDEDQNQDVQEMDVEQAPQQALFQNVEAVPVKVGEARVQTQQPVDEANVVGQVDTQLAQAVQNGESVVRIQLTPEHLGQVTVEISQSAQGVLKVALTASNADTRGLLERHANDLQGLLAGRGSQSVEVSVQRQSESQQDQNQQHQNYDGHNGNAQEGQEREHRQKREHSARPEDFMQQLRLGLIPEDGEF